MGTTSIAGANPYDVSFVPAAQKPGPGGKVDPQGLEVAKEWWIQKHREPDSACLKVEVTHEANSEKQVQVSVQPPTPAPTPGNPNPPAPPLEIHVRNVPQKIRVTLDCGTCTCGKEFGITVTCFYEAIGKQGQVGIPTMPFTTDFLSIRCAGAGCDSTIKIGALRPKLGLDPETYASLTEAGRKEIGLEREA
jgi:hypothetical protein